MSTRIVTLFGEEIIPEPQKPAGKTRAPRKKKAADDTDAGAQEAATDEGTDVTIADNSSPVQTTAVITPMGETPVPEPEDNALTAETPFADIIAPEVNVYTTAEQDIAAVSEGEATEVPAPDPSETQTPDTSLQLVAHTAAETPALVTDAIPDALKPPVSRPAGRDALLAAIRQTVHAPEKPPANNEEPKSETVAENQEKKGRKRAAAGTSETPDNLPEDWKGEKNYYTIGEVAALFNVKTSHIRFWTNDFKLKVRTTRKGDRLYTPDQIKELRTIYHLVKERGFTLSGAKARLKTQNKRDVTTIDLKDALTNLRGKLQILRDQL